MTEGLDRVERYALLRAISDIKRRVDLFNPSAASGIQAPVLQPGIATSAADNPVIGEIGMHFQRG